MVRQLRRSEQKLDVSILSGLDFLKVKVMQKKQLMKPESRKNERGFLKSKKDSVLEKLGPMMTEPQREFWENLKVSDKVIDLSTDHEKDDKLADKVLKEV